MIHPKLRLAAAKFALDLANIADLVDASHAALDDAVYADGLAVIAATPGISRWEADPIFTTALVELGHHFTTQDEALRYLRLSYFGPAAEGAEPPAVALGRYYELRDGMPYGSLAKVSGSKGPSASALMSHWYHREYLSAVHGAGSSVDLPDDVGREWEERTVELSREWCLEYGRLLLQPNWQSETVLALAAGIHAERAFDRLPILADALEEAGCDHPDLLAHCRNPSPHTDYCWVVDLLLGKS